MIKWNISEQSLFTWGLVFAVLGVLTYGYLGLASPFVAHRSLRPPRIIWYNGNLPA